MTDERASGIILRTRPLTETSLVIEWLASELGRVSTVAKGARRPKSPFRGKLDLFYSADFSFARSRRSELHTLREVAVRETRNVLRHDLGSLRQASYGASLIVQTTESGTPIPGIFVLMQALLDQLDGRPPEAMTILAFELKLLQELGQSPNPAESRLSPGARRIVAQLTKLDWEALHRLHLSQGQRREIQQFLHGFLIYHLGRIPAGRSAALGEYLDSTSNRHQATRLEASGKSAVADHHA